MNTTISRADGDMIEISNLGNKKCIAGIYDNDRRLLKVMIFDNETKTKYSENMAYVKVFVLNGVNLEQPIVKALQ